MPSRENKPLVLAGFADSLAAPEAAWSLIDDGFRVAMLARVGEPSPIGADPGVEMLHVTRPETDVAQAARDIATLLTRARPDVLLPLDAASLFLFSRLSPPDECAPAYPVGPQGELAGDDRKQVFAAREAKLDVPQLIHVNRGSDLGAIRRLPVEVRPALQGLARDGGFTEGRAVILREPHEVEAAATQWGDSGPALVWPEPVGQQMTLVGTMTLDGKLRNTAMLRWVRTVAGTPSAVEVVAPVAHTRRHAENMLRANGWRGYAEFEFLRTPDGRDVFRRLRGRLGPVSALVRPLGLDFASWQARQAVDMGFEPPPIEIAEGAVCRHLGLELAHAAEALRFKGPASLGERLGAVTSLVKRGGEQAWCNQRPEAKDVARAETWRVAKAFRGAA